MNKSRWQLAWLLLAVAGPAQAGDFTRNNSIFALSIERQEADWEFAGLSLQATLENLYVSYAEPMLAGGHMGLDFGQTGLTLEGIPGAGSVTAAGYRFGVWLERPLALATSLQLRPRVYYDYYRAAGEYADTQLECTWWNYGASLMLQATLGYVAIAAGPAYDKFAGEARSNGAAVGSYQSTQTRQWVGELRLKVDASGYVGLRGAAGERRRLALYFERRF